MIHGQPRWSQAQIMMILMLMIIMMMYMYLNCNIHLQMLTQATERFQKIQKEAPLECQNFLVQVTKHQAGQNCKFIRHGSLGSGSHQENKDGLHPGPISINLWSHPFSSSEETALLCLLSLYLFSLCPCKLKDHLVFLFSVCVFLFIETTMLLL
uniref:Uncharacterized protein n=1 Tax=Nelumbo nucifera TaxID=4432 RepID=A0A822Y8Q1_NELNU|nr:TPA_asm: hypothetical protein HUJ06_029044 [Nelumbo nucifera]